MNEILAGYLGKRFTGLLVSLGSLTAGYFIGPLDKFGAFASTIGLMYGAYTAGQTYSDVKEK